MTADFPFAPHFFSQRFNDGIFRQHYLDEGAGETIVCVHGNPTWSFFFRDVVKTLSPKFRVLVPDHLGMGLSDKPQDYPYCLATHIANFDRWLAAVTPTGKISLIVHDWGGAIGMGWAVKNPERVKKIVAMNTAAFLAACIPPMIALARVPIFGAAVVRGLNAFVRLANRATTVKPLPPEVRAMYLQPYNSWENRIGVLRFVQDVPMNKQHHSYAALRAIDERLVNLRPIPLLLQWGGRDWCFHRYFFDEWQRRFPNAQADWYPDAGHYLLEDASEKILPRLQEFLTA